MESLECRKGKERAYFDRWSCRSKPLVDNTKLFSIRYVNLNGRERGGKERDSVVREVGGRTRPPKLSVRAPIITRLFVVFNIFVDPLNLK